MLSKPNARVILWQLASAAVFLILLTVIIVTTVSNLTTRGIPVGFDFLANRAGFSISESLLPYSPNDSNLWAIVVGIGNTLWIAALVSLLATIAGTVLALGRIGRNPLLASLAKAWIELARNTPVLLILLFVYTLWWSIPPGTFYEVFANVYVSIRGVAFPKFGIGASVETVAGFALAGVLMLVLVRVYERRIRKQQGSALPYTLIATALLTACMGILLLASGSLHVVSLPAVNGNSIVGGRTLTPELATIIVGLTFYTTGFVAEIVRTGLEAVPKGQWEAARALGLSQWQVIRLVVVPQMMRVILPPMTSQYINVVKNSTLAIVVGYADFMTIMGTIINKTSRAIEGTLVLVVVYLTINLVLSSVLNWYNNRADFGRR